MEPYRTRNTSSCASTRANAATARALRRGTRRPSIAGTLPRRARWASAALLGIARLVLRLAGIELLDHLERGLARGPERIETLAVAARTLRGQVLHGRDGCQAAERGDSDGTTQRSGGHRAAGQPLARARAAQPQRLRVVGLERR